MRLFTGTMFTLLLSSLFAFLFMQVSKEFTHIEHVASSLEERISLDDVRLHNNSYMLDANGDVISDVYAAENRILIAFEAIPETLINLLLATEDRNYFDHPGFDVTGISRALFVNLQSDGIEQGGSTITQQVARNLYLTHDQTYDRKITELLYAYQMEQEFDKEDILTLYFNTIYFANGVYGIEAASRYYFDKTAEELSIAEGAFLLAIPNNPSYYNPLQYKERTETRQKRFISNLHTEGHIDEATANAAMEESVTLVPSQKTDEFPDYVTYVYDELKELIAYAEGFNRRIRSAGQEERARIQEQLNSRVDDLLREGAVIETALDPELQRSVVTSMNNRLRGRGYQGAFALINHHTKELKAITGGYNYSKFDFHRGHRAYRQPGSAFKPLLVYGPLLEETRLTPSSVIDAGPIERNGYSPINFAGAVYGNDSVRNAFMKSYNTAAVRMLDMIGVETGFEYVEQLGFSELVPEDCRLPSALGGLTRGTNVLEMTRAFSVFQTDGAYTPARAIRSVTSVDGELLYEWDDNARQVFSPDTARQMRSLMESVVTDGTANRLQYNLGNYVGGKTGTSNDFHDLWFVGSTDTYTAGVWAGYDSPASLEATPSVHLDLWGYVMRNLP
ncbi:transglycosylase domain-containing protein [Salisediminibacterium selenitireducens]|uniref:Glycosyl transferase family 51 n=1 Tax=Bacillus selenitireducens (strain ATCC 700615 / DSM 15326 / MLS10) TaxID=439292 RepID=D6XXL6_BACIE|nr:transglycosylase domain-containing protein [Salisediminibacterium selenitireducens]ADI00059.1 glycosyl transferase family 51 [[Bacillus] selenitireducens MLS10]